MIVVRHLCRTFQACPILITVRIALIAVMSSPSSPLRYLSQHAEPSPGCAQQAPPFSSGDLLGVQHVDPVEGWAQQPDCE